MLTLFFLILTAVCVFLIVAELVLGGVISSLDIDLGHPLLNVWVIMLSFLFFGAGGSFSSLAGLPDWACICIAIASAVLAFAFAYLIFRWLRKFQQSSDFSGVELLGKEAVVTSEIRPDSWGMVRVVVFGVPHFFSAIDAENGIIEEGCCVVFVSTDSMPYRVRKKGDES